MMKDIQDKIKKLLSLAESDNPYEAQAAALKAQELMLQYNIETIDNNSDEVIIVKYSFADKKREVYHLLLSSLISQNFRTKTYYSKEDVCFVGFEQDAQATLSLYSFLLTRIDVCFESFYTKYLKEHNVKAMNSLERYLRKTWIDGFIIGLKEAFDKRQSDKKYELMVVTPYAVSTAFNNLNLRDSSETRDTSSKQDYEAFKDGRRVGKESLNARSLERVKING